MTEIPQREIILAIPGLWTTRTEIITSLAKKTDGLLLAGNILLDTKTRKGYQVAIYEHDPALQTAFALAGRGLIPPQDLERIAQHTFTLYLLGPGGTLQTAQEIMEVAAQLLKAGGIAVKVETAGVAHTAESWQRFVAHGTQLLSEAYMTLVSGKGVYSSCGMHNLGLCDALVADDIKVQEASRLLRIFLAYTHLEQPSLADGHTFSLDEQSPRYRLTHQEDRRYPTGDLFHNPFGLWHLTRIG